MKACIGSDFAGEMAKSQARLDFRASYEADFEVSTALDVDFVYHIFVSIPIDLKIWRGVIQSPRH